MTSFTDSCAMFFRGTRTIAGGKIYPGGFVRVLDNNVSEPPSDHKDWLLSECNKPGLCIWHPLLAEYAMGYLTKIVSDGIAVHNEGGMVAHCPISECRIIDMHSIKVVDKHGYLAPTEYTEAIGQALSGEKPALLDNSPFFRVDTSFVGMELAILRFSCSNDDGAVYAGNQRIPHAVDYPLSLKKWNPDSPGARYSRG